MAATLIVYHELSLLVVLHIEERQWDIVSGDRRQRGDWVIPMGVYIFIGTQKNKDRLITLFTKLEIAS